MDPQLKQKNQRKVELTFAVMDAMEDLREIWRGTAPLLDLSGEQRSDASALITSAGKALAELEGLL